MGDMAEMMLEEGFNQMINDCSVFDLDRLENPMNDFLHKGGYRDAERRIKGKGPGRKVDEWQEKEDSMGDISEGQYTMNESRDSEYIEERQTYNQKQSNNMGTEQQQKDDGIVLPTKPQKAKAINATSMVIYGKPKVGKTTVLAKLSNCLIIDTEKGSAFVDGMIMSPPEHYGPVGRFVWLKDVAKKIKESGRPYDYVAIDTLSQLDVDAEWVGTYNYMNSISGKKFNRDSSGAMLKSDHPDYESVLTLGNGYGYRYTRDAIMDIYESLKDLGKVCTIFVCHVADKMIANKAGEEVMIKDLALIGKTRDVIPRLCDAIGNVWNEDGKMMISFIGNNEKIGGVRAKHLLGYSGELDWSKIFIKE